MAERDVGSAIGASLPSRQTVQIALERGIEDNRVTIAVLFPLVGAITLIGSAEGWLPPFLAYNALLILCGTLVMRSPLLVGAAPLVDARGLVLVAVLLGYTYAVEIVGVATGIPYGSFEYRVDLGPMLLGVPVFLPVFFIPLVVNGYLLTVLAAPTISRRWWFRVPVAIATVIALDLVLDPAAVAIGFWSFDAGGLYYGVPVSNYLGWFLSATVAVIAIELAVQPTDIRHRANACPFILDDLVSFIVLWGMINLIYLQLVPLLVTIALLLGLLATGRYGLPLAGYAFLSSR